MSDIALVRVTFGDAVEAERIADVVIGERLAACANIDAPCRSIYRWQGQVERGSEVVALFKTSIECAQPLASRIAALHGYDLPAIETWPAAVAREVFDWVRESTGD